VQVPTTAAPQPRGVRLQYKWIVTLVVIFGAFMSILDQTIVNIAIPRLQNAFGADLNSVQWVLTAYILTQGVVTPTTAFFANRLGGVPPCADSLASEAARGNCTSISGRIARFAKLRNGQTSHQSPAFVLRMEYTCFKTVEHNNKKRAERTPYGRPDIRAVISIGGK
jgi:Major Facilitator Superfamily